MSEDALTPIERELLARAKTDEPPPDRLEHDTLSALRERGLIRPRRNWRALGVAALAGAVFAVLAASGAARYHASAAVDAGPHFLVLLYGSLPAEGAAARRAEYHEWMRGLAERGIAISGDALDDGVRQLPAAPSGTGDRPRGYFVIAAPDEAAVAQLATTCPHLKDGGRIVITRIIS